MTDETPDSGTTLKKYKAKIIPGIGFVGGFSAFILACRVWRSFGTPFSEKNHVVKPYTSKRDAMRAADKVAADMGVELDWQEVKK